MKKKIILKIKFWTQINQKKYEKKFKKSIIYYKNNQVSSKNANKNKIDQDDYRIYLGGLRYIPFSISSLLKNLPTPWAINKDLGSLVHSSKCLNILNPNNVIIPEFSSMLWSLIWILNRKEKINRIYFHRLNFPIFDDDDEVLTNSMDFINLKTTYIDFNKHIQTIFKSWFCSGQINCSHCKDRNKKPLLFNDNSLKIITLKTELQSGLYLKKENISQQKNLLSMKKPFLIYEKSKYKKPYDLIQSEKISEKGLENFKKKKPNYLFLYSNQHLSIDISKTYTQKRYFNFKMSGKFIFLKPTFYKGSNFSINLKNSKKKSIFLDFFNKKEIFLYDLIKPFFLDIFFSQPKISFFLNFRFDFTTFLTPFYSQIPTWNTNYLERILLNSTKFALENLSISHLSLLKYLICKNFKSKKNNIKCKIYDVFKKNLYFNKTRTTWIQAGIEICSQSYKLLSILIKRKGLSYLNLDFNFNLKPIRTLSTKERKKSRFSNTFHFFREFLRFMKLLIDCHLKFYFGFIDFFQLSDGIHFILTHIGKITGIYRYKYKIMKQIKICKSIKKIFYEKFYEFPIPKGPGFGFWVPVWKVWIFFLRGMVPIQERWISNLLTRHLYGRRYSRKSFSMTTQRKEAYLDIELKLALLNEINNLKGKDERKNNLKTYIKNSNDAWKSWKSNRNWNPVALPGEIENLILDYVKTKSIWWVKTACLVRESLIRGVKVEKSGIKKNLGRITRLWFKAEQSRQLEYLKKGPYFSKSDTFFIEEIFEYWIKTCQIQKILFPCFKNKWDLKLLILSLDKIKKNNLFNKMDWRAGSLEQNLLQNAMNNPVHTFIGIKDSLLSQRIFFEVGLNFIDNFSYLNPVYMINFEEKITDGYLDQYIWYECSQKMIFPSWIKPIDAEINPYMIYKLQIRLNETQTLNTNKGKTCVCVGNVDFCESSDNSDLILMDKILNKIIDRTITSYLTSKNNININFKDMSCLNSLGIIRGFQVASFLIQLYYFIFDLLLLGLKNALWLLKNNGNLGLDKTAVAFIFYIRYISKAIFMSISVDFGGIENLFLKIRTKIPSSLGSFKLDTVFDNSNIFNKTRKKLSIELGGFSLFLKQNIYPYTSFKIKNRYREKRVELKISSSALFHFEGRIRQIILNSGSTTFTKIANKWNSSILGIIAYFREFVKKNHNFFNIFSTSEEKIQIRIKTSFNSKMPSRFPMVLFFAPKELGGLGMFSVSNFIIPDNDLKFKNFSKKNKKKIKKTKNGNHIVSVITNFIKPWKNEFQESKKIWSEFVDRRRQLKKQHKNISFEDVEDLWNNGLPRINTLFQKEREILAFDHGWRIRVIMEKFQVQKNNPFWWTTRKHDGRLWDLDFYKTELIKNLGGITNILEHSLFKGTYFPTWEGLFWEKSSGFEEILENKKLTHAQRSGLNQIPNRRFTLWWSPTINRANVYIGFQVQLDLTGIFMHGKIPTLKISLIQIFRAHLWQKIHQSITLNLCKLLEQNIDKLTIASIQQEQIHPRKSYKMNSSCADILLISSKSWKISRPSLLSAKNSIFTSINGITTDFWVDLQLRWGDFDSHDIERYAREKFLDFTVYQNGLYPCKYGIIVGIDLSYNIFSGFGFVFPHLKEIMSLNLNKIMKSNSALYILRDRIRKGLQLHTGRISGLTLSIGNYFEIFQSGIFWIIDDSLFYRVSVHQTLLGNIKTKPINGAVIIFLPKNGNLILRIISSNTWKQQKRLSQLARWKAAEEIFNFLQGVSSNEWPDQIILLRKTLLDPLEIHLIEYPSILIKCSNFRISFQSLLKIKKIGKKISISNTNQTIFFNLYDNWINTVSPFTAFSRLVLILRGFEVDEKKMKKILGISLNLIEKDRFWPIFNDKEWIENEIIIKDLILENFANKNKIDPENFFQTEVRDIIFGSYIKEPESFLTANKNNKLHTVSTCNNFGKRLRTLVSFKNIKKQFVLNPFKTHSIGIGNAVKLLKKIKIKKEKGNRKSGYYIFPRNLLKKISLDFFSGTKNVSIALGKNLYISVYIIEIRILLLVPEKKENLHRILCDNNWKFKLFKSMRFLGYIIKGNKYDSSRAISNFSLKKSKSTMEIIKNQGPIVIVFIFFAKNHIFMKCINLNLNSEASVLISNKYFGLYFDFLMIIKLILNCLT